MLVYGDSARTEDPAAWIGRIEAALRRAREAGPGLAAHASLVGALIEAGELAQGIADAEFAARGGDGPSDAQDAVDAWLMALARAVLGSWDADFPGAAELRVPDRAALARLRLPDRITGKRAEGFAFYALYPEGYAEAARASGLGADTACLGIRSIGLPLASITAAALDARAPLSLRPVGHPFDRRLALAEGAWLRARAAHGPVAIIDEGPGLSGSSFGAVADHLEDSGVAPERIAFFPSHAGDLGPRAQPRHRARWARARRWTIPFARLVGDGAPRAHRLSTWVEGLVGPLDGPAEEISGGAWRRLHFAEVRDWPAIDPQQERRKVLLRAGGGTWLAKFVGLGATGERALARARALHEAGFGPPVAGLAHGFLVERWLHEARPLARGVATPDVIEAAGRYLAFRALSFPSGPGRGASLAELLAMARHNAAAVLGAEAARGLGRYDAARLAALEEQSRPVEVDARMQPWEWLLLPDGSVRKADALDHHAGHDLVGCQDIAWDVAGACVEFDLPAAGRDRLATTVAAGTGRPVDGSLLGFLIPCYLAFRLGASRLAAEATGDPDEGERLRRAADTYARHLARHLSEDR
ncbi:hypothetical protein [Methylobacterium sp. JK268]